VVKRVRGLCGREGPWGSRARMVKRNHPGPSFRGGGRSRLEILSGLSGKGGGGRLFVKGEVIAETGSAVDEERSLRKKKGKRVYYLKGKKTLAL